MLKTKQIVNSAWKYGSLTRELQIGDKISFTCNGFGRGGHYGVTAVVTKVNRKTLLAIEAQGSYKPGTEWKVRTAGDLDIYIELPAETAVK